jgi:hypothetical protein
MKRSYTNGWTTPADIKALLLRRWQRGQIIASSLNQDSLFPLHLPIKGPSSAQISADFGAARDWITEWGNQKVIPIAWRTFSHRLFGDNQMPSAAIIPDAESAVRILGTRSEWQTHQEMIARCRETFPELLDWLAKQTVTALELAPDWKAILAVVAWVRENPRSGMFLRQMDAPGVHTKLVEKHRSVISQLLDRVLPADAIDDSAGGAAGFARRYGFRDKPERIRVRFLDPACAIAPERIGLDFTLTATAFATLDPHVQRVFITENEVNFLAFPDCKESMAIFGAGYGWSALAGAPWLLQRAIYYWGDIDTHGFAILDQLRAYLPHTRSLLMNRETFHAFREFWTVEAKPARKAFHRLNADEASLLDDLQQDKLGSSLRLEQEIIPYPSVLGALREIGIFHTYDH